jgi:predicted lipoprotein with Yx(FWY)xxD motif
VRPALRLVAAAATLVALPAGCGGQPTERSAAAAPAAATGSSVKTVRSQFGRILADGRGQAIYRFSRETSGASRCYDACAKAWPPVPARGRPMAGRGAHTRLIGTTRRRDGTLQLTYAGRPVYYYVRDSPGRVLCHDVTEFGGVWRVMRGDGSAVR